MRKAEWTGEDLKNLLTKSKAELIELYPEYKWDTLKRTRNKKKKQIREGRLTTEAATPEDLFKDLPKDNKDEVIQQLKDMVKREQKKRDEALDGKQEYIATLRSAFLEATEGIKLDIPKPQELSFTKSVDEEIAVVMVSDLQLGKVTATYNMDVCAERMKLLAAKIARFTQIQQHHHPVREIHVLLLGDIVEGENIFPNQAYQISAGNYRQMNYGWGILVQFLLDMLATFEKVHVVGVIGNHGRISGRGGDIDPETNMDRMLYDRVRGTFQSQVFEEPRITFNIPDGTGLRSWYALDRVFDWGFLCCHGDQINGWAGIPFYGTQKKALGWIDAIDEPWDYLCMGHYHTSTMLTYNKRKVFFNGSTESSNEFAQEKIAAVGYPTQNLLFVHPRHGVTSHCEIKLEEAASNLQRARDVVKTFGSKSLR